MSWSEEQSRRKFLKEITAAGVVLFSGPGLGNLVANEFQDQKQKRLVIGDEALDKENEIEYFFNLIRDATVDNEGNIYILDSLIDDVRKFSPEGKFIKIIGKKGQGPSEYGGPLYIRTDGKENLYVYDSLRRRIVQQDLSGKQVTSVDVAKLEWLMDFQVLNDDKLLVHNIKLYPPDLEQAIFHIVDMKNNGSVIDSFGDIPTYPQSSKEDKKVYSFVDEHIKKDAQNADKFFRGIFAVDQASEQIYFVRELYPKELLVYNMGENEPRTLSVDADISGGFTTRPILTRSGAKTGRIGIVSNQSTRGRISLVDNTLYTMIHLDENKKFIVKGYSTSDGENTFKKQIESDYVSLRFVDNKLNGYFSEGYRLIREPLK